MRAGAARRWPVGGDGRLLGGDGQAGGDPEAVARAGGGFDGPADGGGSLAHAGQPVARVRDGRGGLRAAAGVGHLDQQLPVAVGEGHGGGRRPGVPDGVGQRFLHDAVGGQVDGGGQRDRRAGHGERRVQARLAGARDQRAELRGARGRLGRVAVIGLAEHVEDGAQLLEPFLAGRPDGGQRLGGRLRPGGQHMGGHPGLHVDGGHGVRDDVVQFPGDAQPLLVDPTLGVLLGPGPDGGHVSPPVGQRDPAEHDGRAHPGDEVEPAGGDLPERVACGGGGHQHPDRDQPGRNGPACAALSGDRVQSDDGRQEGSAVDVAEQGVGGHRGGADGQHGERVAAPPGQGQAGDRDQGQRRRRMRRLVAVEIDDVGCLLGVPLAVAAPGQDHGHDDGQDHIRGRPARPPPPRRHDTVHAARLSARSAGVSLPGLTARLLPRE